MLICIWLANYVYEHVKDMPAEYAAVMRNNVQTVEKAREHKEKKSTTMYNKYRRA